MSVRKPERLVRACPSGLVTVMVTGPAGTPMVLRSSVMEVGFVYVTELTDTPPDTEAASRFGNPAPGSNQPEPETDVPVTTTGTEAWPAATVSGAAVENAAGGGAISSATRTP